jgi:hypothetical protein
MSSLMERDCAQCRAFRCPFCRSCCLFLGATFILGKRLINTESFEYCKRLLTSPCPSWFFHYTSALKYSSPPEESHPYWVLGVFISWHDLFYSSVAGVIFVYRFDHKNPLIWSRAEFQDCLHIKRNASAEKKNFFKTSRFVNVLAKELVATPIIPFWEFDLICFFYWSNIPTSL